MEDYLQDLQTDLITLSARGKRILLLWTDAGFTAVVLERGDSDALLAERPVLAAFNGR